MRVTEQGLVDSFSGVKGSKDRGFKLSCFHLASFISNQMEEGRCGTSV